MRTIGSIEPAGVGPAPDLSPNVLSPNVLIPKVISPKG
jgi:hypothetical protein